MLGRYLITLLLTLAVEGAVAYVLGLRKGKYLLALVMINIITHLILNYFLAVLAHLGIGTPFVLIIILESLVVVAEWQLLVYIFHNPKGRFLITSLLGNVMSFLIGLLVFWT